MRFQRYSMPQIRKHEWCWAKGVFFFVVFLKCIFWQKIVLGHRIAHCVSWTFTLRIYVLLNGHTSYLQKTRRTVKKICRHILRYLFMFFNGLAFINVLLVYIAVRRKNRLNSQVVKDLRFAKKNIYFTYNFNGKLDDTRYRRWCLL